MKKEGEMNEIWKRIQENGNIRGKVNGREKREADF